MPHHPLPALEGHKAELYRNIAEMFLTSPNGHVSIEDFGSPKERYSVSPIIGYLARRNSEKLRVQLGLSRIENGHVRGAILRHSTGKYEYVRDFHWPKGGEVDPGLLRAEEHRIRREAKRVQASRRTPKSQQRTIEEAIKSETSSETPATAPLVAADPPPVPTPTTPPSEPPTATQTPQEASGTQILTRTGEVLVILDGSDLIVAIVKSVTKI